MATLILDDDQARIVRSASTVELMDQSGNLIGHYVLDELEEDLRLARETLARNEETFTTAQVLGYLRSLAPE